MGAVQFAYYTPCYGTCGNGNNIQVTLTLAYSASTYFPVVARAVETAYSQGAIQVRLACAPLLGPSCCLRSHNAFALLRPLDPSNTVSPLPHSRECAPEKHRPPGL